jgi:hypothetical protein
MRIVVILILLATSVAAQQSRQYRCPQGDAQIPASCLELIKVRGANRPLNSAERHQLAYLFAKSYVVSIVKYKQDYYINSDAPISRLMVANFPDFRETRKEGGLSLRDLFNFFRAQSLYRPDVEKSLRRLSVKQRDRVLQ